MAIKYVFNPFTGKFDAVTEVAVNVSNPDPSSPSEGLLTINSSTHEFKVYYGGAWQVLHTLITPEHGASYLNEDGTYYLTEDGGRYLLE